MTSAAVLLLADGRFPAGGHAHSFGLEPAVAAGEVTGVASLERFVVARLRDTGVVEAGFAAAAARAPSTWAALDVELDARIPSAAQREVSRRLGRQLQRAATAIWGPLPCVGAHQPVVLGVVADAAGIAPDDVATVALHQLASSVASAAVRLLALDPYLVHERLVALGPTLERLAAEAVAELPVAGNPPTDVLAGLPVGGNPLIDVLAEHHATWEVRLFGS